VHTRIQPLIDYTAHNAISHPLVKEFPYMAMIDMVEETSDVDFHNPASVEIHQPLPTRFERVVG